MRIRLNQFASVAMLAAYATIAGAQGADLSDPLALTQKRIARYLTALADLHCTETVTQQKLGPNGHVDATVRSQFDYLIMMSGSNDEFQLNESRIEPHDPKQKMGPMPMLTSNGIATVLLVFHPYYSGGFEFEARPDEMIAGKQTVPIHFSHIAGRRTPAALALRGREFPLELEGTAWLDKTSGDVVAVDAALQHDMSDVGLRALHIHVEYKPVTLANEIISLPFKAEVDLSTPRQHWRNAHIFENYKSFSAAAEQDPNYKIQTGPPAGASPTSTPPDTKDHP